MKPRFFVMVAGAVAAALLVGAVPSRATYEDGLTSRSLNCRWCLLIRGSDWRGGRTAQDHRSPIRGIINCEAECAVVNISECSICNTAVHVIGKSAVHDAFSSHKRISSTRTIESPKCGGQTGAAWINGECTRTRLQPVASAILSDSESGPIIERGSFHNGVFLGISYVKSWLPACVCEGDGHSNNFIDLKWLLQDSGNRGKPSTLALFRDSFSSLQRNDSNYCQNKSSNGQDNCANRRGLVWVSDDRGNWAANSLSPSHLLWWSVCLVIFGTGMYGGLLFIASIIERRPFRAIGGIGLVVFSAVLIGQILDFL